MDKPHYRLIVDHVERNADGSFTCLCAEHGSPDYTERTVTEAELLAYLGANADGSIPTLDESWNAERGDIDQREDSVTLTEWLAYTSGIDLEDHMAMLLDRREGRTVAAPLKAGTLTAMNAIAHLSKTAA